MLRARREKEASAKVKFKETSLENDYSVQGEIGSAQCKNLFERRTMLQVKDITHISPKIFHFEWSRMIATMFWLQNMSDIKSTNEAEKIKQNYP